MDSGDEMERGPPSAALRRCQSGRSGLLLDDDLLQLGGSMQQQEEEETRTVLPISKKLLAGVDSDGSEVPIDAKAVEETLDMYSVLIEYAKMPPFAPDGIYCMPTWNDVRTWDGVAFLRHGVYQGGLFKFRIGIPKAYPNIAPKLTFLSRVFHPLVDEETGELCIKAYFKEWNSERDYIPMLLLYLKTIFLSKDLLRGTADEKNWKNKRAAQLFREDKATLLKEIRKCVKESQEKSLTPVEQQQALAAAAPAAEREPPTAAAAVLHEDASDFVFNFREFHRQQKPLLHAITLLASDETCADPTQAFVEWFADDWSKAEFEREENKPP